MHICMKLKHRTKRIDAEISGQGQFELEVQQDGMIRQRPDQQPLIESFAVVDFDNAGPERSEQHGEPHHDKRYLNLMASKAPIKFDPRRWLVLHHDRFPSFSKKFIKITTFSVLRKSLAS